MYIGATWTLQRSPYSMLRELAIRWRFLINFIQNRYAASNITPPLKLLCLLIARVSSNTGQDQKMIINFHPKLYRLIQNWTQVRSVIYIFVLLESSNNKWSHIAFYLKSMEEYKCIMFEFQISSNSQWKKRLSVEWHFRMMDAASPRYPLTVRFAFSHFWRENWFVFSMRLWSDSQKCSKRHKLYPIWSSEEGTLNFEILCYVFFFVSFAV